MQETRNCFFKHNSDDTDWYRKWMYGCMDGCMDGSLSVMCRGPRKIQVTIDAHQRAEQCIVSKEEGGASFCSISSILPSAGLNIVSWPRSWPSMYFIVNLKGKYVLSACFHAINITSVSNIFIHVNPMTSLSSKTLQNRRKLSKDINIILILLKIVYSFTHTYQ